MSISLKIAMVALSIPVGALISCALMDLVIPAAPERDDADGADRAEGASSRKPKQSKKRSDSLADSQVIQAEGAESVLRVVEELEEDDAVRRERIRRREATDQLAANQAVLDERNAEMHRAQAESMAPQPALG